MVNDIVAVRHVEYPFPDCTRTAVLFQVYAFGTCGDFETSLLVHVAETLAGVAYEAGRKLSVLCGLSSEIVQTFL